jgi:hypothetical protein
MLDAYPFGSPNMARMRSLLRPAWWLALAVAALALAVSLPAFAGPPGNIEVTVERPNGTSKSIVASTVSPDITGPYTVRQSNGTTTQVAVEDGVSIRELLVDAQAELGYGTLEIRRPTGGVVKLTREEIDAAVPRPPVIYSDASGVTWFLRSSTSPTDVNATDHFQISSSTLAMTQIAGELEVAVKASRKKIDPGQSIEFTAKVTGGPSDAEYTYEWNFNDGKRLTDGRATETHKFTKEGSFKVLASVTIVGESRSDSGVVEVQVGDTKASDEDRAGGGDNGAAGAPDSGAATGSEGDGSSYGSGSTYTPAPPPLPPAPPTPTPAPEPSLTPDVPTSGTTVEGNLLADVSDPPPSNILESAARAARDGNPKDDAPDGADVPEAALSIAGVLALLGLGAGIETRQGRPPRLRLPRSPLPRRGA